MMKLSLICMVLMFCLFADTKQTNVADTISATTGNFSVPIIPGAKRAS